MNLAPLAETMYAGQARPGHGRGEFLRWPYGPVTTPNYANAGRGAGKKVPQLWLYADNDRLYDETLIREYYQAFSAAGGSARFELLRGIPADGHLLRLYPDRWRSIADEFLTSLNRQHP